MAEKTSAVNLGRHKRNCSICAHEKVDEIEAAFVSWKSPAAIAEEFGLADRTTVYRHAHALGLFPKRQRNLRGALEKIIERVDSVELSGAAVVAAIQAYAKINTQGEWVERVQTTNLNQLFDRMSAPELESYAAKGELPGWFTATVRATAQDGEVQE